MAPAARTTEWPGRKSPKQAGYTNATALTTGAKAKLCSLLVGRVHILIVRLGAKSKIELIDAANWDISRTKKLETLRAEAYRFSSVDGAKPFTTKMGSLCQRRKDESI